MAKEAGLSEQRLGRKNIFSPCAKISLMVLKAYTGFSDRQLVEHLNGNIHYQMFCGVMIDPSNPITWLAGEEDRATLAKDIQDYWKTAKFTGESA